NVGEISLSFWPEFRTNDPSIRLPRERVFDREVMLAKGDELGTFHMGSTVVCLFAPEVLAAMPALSPAIERLRGRKVRVRSNLTSSHPLSVPALRNGASV